MHKAFLEKLSSATLKLKEGTMLWELLTLRKSRTFYCEFYDLNSFFIFEQVFAFYQLITLVTLMWDPLKTAMGSWAPSLHIITILFLLLL